MDEARLVDITLTVSSGKRNASVWRPSVCPIFLPTLIGHAAQTQRDSPEGSTRRYGHTCLGDDVRWRLGRIPARDGHEKLKPETLASPAETRHSNFVTDTLE